MESVMEMVFRKSKMIARLIEEGREDMITKDVEAIMDNLDGQKASESCWRRQVYDEPVLWVVGKDGKGEYVNERDCE